MLTLFLFFHRKLCFWFPKSEEVNNQNEETNDRLIAVPVYDASAHTGPRA